MNMIGAYGPWMASLAEDPPELSFRRQEWSDVEAWRPVARQKVFDCLAMPGRDAAPQVTLHDQYTYDGLHVEELSWQRDYGPRTEAILLKPADSSGALPGILALHDHAGNKYFGKRKIARTSDDWHPMIREGHAPEYYGGVAWANQIAKRGYAVLIPDAFAFGSRRVRPSDVSEVLRGGISDTDLDDEPGNSEAIGA